jgi:hypothetical protein
LTEWRWRRSWRAFGSLMKTLLAALSHEVVSIVCLPIADNVAGSLQLCEGKHEFSRRRA